jgi:hypothetical protein
MLISDWGNFCIRKICMKSGIVSTFAGTPNERGSRNGPKEQALFTEITKILFSPDGKFVFICDSNNLRLIKIKN